MARKLRRRIGLISKEYEEDCFAPHFKRIAEIAEEQRIETLLFSLWSYCRETSRPQPSQDLFFRGKHYLKRVVLESAVWSARKNWRQRMECWEKDEPTRVFSREFAHSAAPRSTKLALVEKFPSERILGGIGTLYCGEIGLLKVNHQTHAVVDEFKFLRLLKNSKTGVVACPSHTVFRRWEIKKKQIALSKGGRVYLGVWNSEKHYKKDHPWVCFKNGKDRTEDVKEIAKPIPKRPDIRMGFIVV